MVYVQVDKIHVEPLKGKGMVKTCEKILAEIFLNLINCKTIVSRNSLSPKHKLLKHIIIKLLNYDSDKEKILKAIEIEDKLSMEKQRERLREFLI